MSVSRAVKHSDIRDPPDNLVPKNKFSVKTASAQDAYDKIAEEMQLELEDTRAELQNELNARDDAIAARLHEERADTIDKISKLQRGYEDVRQKAEEANERLKEAMERLSLENSSLKSARANDEELFLKLTLPIRLMPYRTQLGLPDEQIETDLSAPQVSGTYSAIMPLDDHCFDLDTIISKLKKAVWSWPGTKVQLLEAQIWWLCTRAKNVFMSQPALLEVNAPINVSIYSWSAYASRCSMRDNRL